MQFHAGLGTTRVSRSLRKPWQRFRPRLAVVRLGPRRAVEAISFGFLAVAVATPCVCRLVELWRWDSLAVRRRNFISRSSLARCAGFQTLPFRPCPPPIALGILRVVSFRAGRDANAVARSEGGRRAGRIHPSSVNSQSRGKPRRRQKWTFEMPKRGEPLRSRRAPT